MVTPIKCVSLYILSESGEKKTLANYYHPVSATAIGANYLNPVKTVLNKEEPPLKRDANVAIPMMLIPNTLNGPSS